MTSQQISAGTQSYFRARLGNRLHEAVIDRFAALQKIGFTHEELARRIGRDPGQVRRWLGSPGGWTIDIASDLLLGMNCELDFLIRTMKTSEEQTINLLPGAD